VQATHNHRPGSPPHNRRMQTAAASSPKAPKNKTLAAWLAFITGQLGVHRLYLFGLGDVWAWLHPIAAALGWWGVERVRLYGQDDHLAWVLIPLLGFTLAGTALTAIYYGLMPTEKWNALHNAGTPATQAGNTNWLTIGAVVFALLFGTISLMSSIVFSFQRYFEYQVEEAKKISQ
jgi:hypothetical protein